MAGTKWCWFGREAEMEFSRRHLLGLEGMPKEEILFLLDTAASFKEISDRDIKKVPTLRGKTVVAAFFEPSTRTRVSFEIAAKRMSADFVSLSAPASSAAKGETLLDTARNLSAMQPDALVIRHPSAGAAHLLARHLDCAVINAGDGAHEHPTQALLDLLTIRERKPQFEGLVVAIVGDILHSRVARSNLHALRTLGAEVRLAGPRTLLPRECAAFAVATTDLREAVRGADVVMVLRLQRERQVGNYIPSIEEYARYFCLREEHLAEARPDVLVMHPGPLNRGVEIASSVADGPYSVILDQVRNGIAVRMAVLYLLLTGAREAMAATREQLQSIPAGKQRRVGR
jgi:aspartate carbamoyltransferase catalytic subunit